MQGRLKDHLVAHQDGERIFFTRTCTVCGEVWRSAARQGMDREQAAAEAGVDSIEHGAYLDDDALCAMSENGTIWVPTLSAIGNLRGRGRFDEGAVSAIHESAVQNLRRFAQMGGLIAPGSDAGAWAVPHGSGGMDEYAHLAHALGDGWEGVVNSGTDAVRTKF